MNCRKGTSQRSWCNAVIGRLSGSPDDLRKISLLFSLSPNNLSFRIVIFVVILIT
ncbi:hypothetical protein M139_4710 [Bacteroides fragilis str. S23L24]|nr:hypothetical protein M139_4710 [Bacteroides fragilis str. S23L24]